jgi:hypothetical protein
MQLLTTLVLCRLHGMMECWARSEALALSWNNIKANGILPDPEFFKSSVDVFSIHGLFIP